MSGVVGFALVAGGSAALAPTTALAAPLGLTVSTTNDVAVSAGACGDPSIVVAPSPLSLREATCIANNRGGEVPITLPAGTYELLHGELQLGAAVGAINTLTGAGPGSTVITAGRRSRVLNLDFNQVGGMDTTISGVTIRGGDDATFGGAGIIGGSNLNAAGDSLTIDNSIITDNHVTADPTVTNQMGGGIQFLGGSLDIRNSVISNNTSGSSRGSGLSYEANGDAADEQLTIAGSTFSGNTVTAAAAGVPSGGALAVAGTAGRYAVSDSHFLGNEVVGTGAAAPRGAAIWSQSGELDVLRSTFTDNTATGGVGPAGGAIAVDSGSLTAHFNRFAGNGAGGSALSLGSLFTADATQNWWGCNTGPNTPGCDSVVGTLVASPRLVLSATASPATMTGPDAASTITASLTKDSSGADVPASSLSAFAGVFVVWGNPQPSGAAVTSNISAINAGSATTTYDSNGANGSGGVDAQLDSGVATAALSVNLAPSFTSPAAAAFQAGVPVNFMVTATGYPAPDLVLTTPVPPGLTFTDNGNGTGSLTGTPTISGSHAVQVVAQTGVHADVVHNLTIEVRRAPTFTSPSGATLQIGRAGSFTVTTAGGFPTATTLTRTGTLPVGVTFVDNRDGTATLAGTPAAGSAGSYPMTVTASNGVVPNASQSFVLTVAPAPVTSPITAKYNQLGGAGSVLGAATGPEYRVAGGTARDYRFGRIYHSARTGAHEVHGVIATRYASLGGPAGWLGFPTTDEITTPGRTGAYNHFEGGNGASIYWSPRTGAWSVHGMIRTKWFALGAERGIFGFPITDEVVTGARTGAFNHFAGGDGSSIYWSPRTGAWSVHGAIRTKWYASGGENGRLGYPVSDEYGVPGGRRSDFTGGSVVWRFTGLTTVAFR